MQYIRQVGENKKRQWKEMLGGAFGYAPAFFTKSIPSSLSAKAWSTVSTFIKSHQQDIGNHIYDWTEYQVKPTPNH